MEETKKLTYSMYGKEYDFEDLLRKADEGLNQYISTLKRGYKDLDKFRLAYYNLMSGIQDGTITFLNGQYIDSTGRYTNSENKKKDYYGLMANYIYNQQRRGKLYTPPEDDSKIKWGTHTLANLIKLGLLGNSDNALDFIDLDEVVNNVRSNTNRIKALLTVFTDLRDNFDSKFTGYTDKLKEEAMQYLNGAITALSDNKADNKDWLALNRIGGIDFRALLSTAGTPTEAPKIEIPMGMTALEYDEFKKLPELEQLLRTDLYNLEQEKARREAYNNLVKAYLNNLWSTYLSANPSIADFTLVQTNATYNTLNNTPHKNWSTIGKVFIQAIKLGRFRGADETTSIVTFVNRGISLSQYMSAMYNTFKKYPNAINNFAKLLHDSKGNKVYQIRNSKNLKGEWLYMVPITKNGKTVLRFFRSKLYSDILLGIPGWTKYGRNGAVLYKLERFKSGGIIKAQRGVKTNAAKSYYSTVFLPNFAHILEGLGKENSADYANWLNGMQDKHYEIWNIAGRNPETYSTTAVKDARVGSYLNDYKNGFNSEFNNDGKGYNTLGIANAVAQGRYDLSGSTRTSGDWNSLNWTTDSLFSSITDDRRLLGRKGDFTDEELASINELLKAKNYQMVLGENSYYYLKPLETTVEKELEKPYEERKKSIVNPIGEFTKPKGNSLSNTITLFAPTALSAIRYLGALRSNNRVASTIKDSISPVIKNTYELYSPVTGAFSTMQFKNNLAASLRRMLPFTSDGSLELARRFEANRLARQLEAEGFLADNAEILRTRAEALKRLEDNKARRTQTANENMAAIALANREKAQIEALRLKLNFDSTNNFLADIESRIRNNNEEKRLLALNAALQGASSEYQLAYQNLSRIYREAHPNASTSDMLNDPNYVDAVRKLRELYNYRNYQIGTGKYRNPYANFILLSYEDILNNISFGRKGGILKKK